MFKNKSKEEIINSFSGYNYKISTYYKNEIIALEGAPCKSIGLVLDGLVDIKRILTSNTTVHISSFNKGNLFGEVIAFCDINQYPATVISSTDSEIMFILKEDFINYCTHNPLFLNDFLNDLSNKIVSLNKSITNLSLSSIRHKVCNFIITEYNIQNTKYISLNMTKQKLSEILGIPRPSLSRELINLKNIGVLDFSKNHIKILDLNKIEDFLTQ